MKKTFLPVILILTLLLSQFSVFAFDDMNEDRLSWAKTAVEEMAEAGLIKGYEDGTFRPDNSVTKQEALILIARMLGFTEKSSAKYSEIASEVYADALADFATPYKNEISYLLYRGVLTAGDLSLYVADTEASHPLKRYEAAILLTKIFERDLAAVEKSELTITFDDIADIPATAKAYVNYVCDKGIMNGMGDNLFVPNGELTRAMIATLLYRIIPVIDYSYIEGEMLRYDADTASLRLTKGDDTATYTVKSDVAAVCDGAVAKVSDIKAGSKVRITFSGADAFFVEAISSEFETTVSGIYNGYNVYEDATSILIKDAKTGESEGYVISPSITVSKNGKSSSVSELIKSDYITASIKAGKIIHISAEDKTVTVSGTIDSIVFEPDFAINVAVGKEVIAYDCADSVKVRRNNKVTDLTALVAGDNVKLTLVYGLISEIAATSTTTTETGVISEIVISNTPSIKVKIDGDEYTYHIARNPEITSANGDTIYDLRLGDTVTLTIEGKTATEIETIVSVDTSTNVTGIVESVETSYGYIKLQDSTSLVFTKGAKVQDSSGTSMTVKNIKAGDSVTIFGKTASGAIEASLIVVNK